MKYSFYLCRLALSWVLICAGVIVSAQTLTPAGGLDFDGIDDYVSIPNSSANNFSINQDFTVSFKVKIPSAGQATQVYSDNDIVEKWDGIGSYPFVFRYSNSLSGVYNGKISACRWNGSVGACVTSTSSLNDDQWHHVALVKKGTLLTLFIDGAAEATTTDLSGGNTANTSNLYLGRRGGSTAQSFKGALDELRIYSRSLCSSEIISTMNCELSAGQIGLTAYYRFNSGYLNANNSTYTTAFDESGNANNGTLYTGSGFGFALNGTTSNWVAGGVSGTCTLAIPRIASFTPSSGAQGASVVISGNNFNATPSSNVVYFGAIRAVVTAASSTSLTVTVPAGATYAPISVTDQCSGFTGYSANNFLLTAPCSSNVSANSFTSASTLSTPSPGHPYNVALADLDNDGKVDLLTSNNGGNSFGAFSAFRNTSTTGSISWAAAVTPASSGNSPLAIYAEDIDGDGRKDVILTNGGSGTILVYRNTTTGTTISFATPVSLICTAACGVAVLDMDGDGKPDIVAANYNNNQYVRVFRNTSTNGALSFGVPVLADAGGLIIGVCTADMDGDNLPDIITTNITTGEVAVMKNNSTPGSLSFGSASKFSVGNVSQSANFDVGDLDGDGKADIAVGLSGGSAVAILRNTTSSGSISFASVVTISTSSAPYGVRITDMNGDGLPDIVANYFATYVSVFQNSSTPGTLSFSGTNFSVSGGSWNAAVADLDNDGRNDIVVPDFTNSQVSTLRGLATPPSISSLSPANATLKAGETITINGSGFSSVPANNTVQFGAIAGTVTAASAASLSVTVPGGATYAPVSVTNTCGYTGYSSTPLDLSFCGNQVLNTSSFTNQTTFSTYDRPYSVALGDLNGDGKNEMVVASYYPNYYVSVFPNTATSGTVGTSSFGTRQDYAAKTQPYYVQVQDMDGDGRPDVIVACQQNGGSVYLNTSSGSSVSLGTRFDLPSGNYSVAVGDLDQDGKPDLVFAGTSTYLYKNNSTPGNLSFSNAGLISVSIIDVAVRDFDGDGKLDIVGSNYGGNQLVIYQNQNTVGSLSSASFSSVAPIATLAGPYGITVADFDGDGKADVATVCRSAGQIQIFRNTSTATGNFSWAAGVSIGGNYSILAADITGDGKPDIIRGGSPVQVLVNNASPGNLTASSFSAYNASNQGAYGNDENQLALGDIDGDGKPDLASTNDGNGTSAFVTVARNVIVPAAPSVTASGPTTFCQGGSVTLTASTGASYNWSTSATTPSILVNQSGNYSVTVVSANGCSATSAPTSVTVNTRPSGIISGSTTVYAGQKAQLTLSVTGTGTISGTLSNGTGFSGLAPTIKVAVAPTASTTYTIATLTDQKCSANASDLSGSATVTVLTAPINICNNSALQFNGKTFVDCGNNSSLTITNSITLEAWIKPSAYGGYIISKAQEFNSEANYNLLLAANGVLEFAYWEGTNVNKVYVSGSGAIPLNTWSHVAVAYNYSTHAIQLYVNGSSVTGSWLNNNLPINLSPITTSNSMTIGASKVFYAANGLNVGDPSNVFNGNIDEVRVWNTALSAATIAQWRSTQIYNAHPNYSNLKGYWRFNEGNGGITFDASGNSNHGTLINAPIWAASAPIALTATVTPNGPTTFCQNGSVTLTANSNMAAYLWSNSSTASTINVNTGGDYSVTITDGDGCTSTSAALTVVVNSLPAVYNVTGGGAYCAGGSGVDIGLSNSETGVSYQLKMGSTDIGTHVAGTGASLSFGNHTTAGIYTVVATNTATNCTSVMNGSATVTVNPYPTVFTVTGGGANCDGAGGVVVGLNGSEQNTSYDLIWNGFPWVSVTGTGAAITFGNQQQSGTYTVVASRSSCSSNMNGSAAVLINPNPVPTISASGPTTFCQGGSVTLTAFGGSTYTWSNAATTQAISVSQSGNYTVTVTDGNGCIATATKTVTVHSNPVVVASSNTPVNSGNTIILSATGANAYSWTGPNSFSANGASVNIANATTADGGTYTVTGTDGNGCFALASTNVIVYPPGEALSFDGLNDYVNAGNVTAADMTGPITLEAWVYPTANNGDGIIINNEGRYEIARFSNGELQFAIANTSPGWNWVNTHLNIPLNQWTHISLVYDLSNVIVRLNGGTTIANTFTTVAWGALGDAHTTFNDLRIGGRQYPGGNGSQFFAGKIDEVRIWNNALCQPEILAHMNCELSGAATNLVTCYHLNEGFAGANNAAYATAAEASGHGSNGALVNFALNGTTSNWAAPGAASGTCTPFLAPDIALQGSGGNNINRGGTTTSSVNGTDLGGTLPNTTLTSSYTISNTGTAGLTVSSINITGADASNFSVGGITSFPITIAANSSASFNVTFSSPVASVATYNATIHVANDVCNKGDYDFAVKAQIICSMPAFTVCPSNILTNTTATSCDNIATYTPSFNGSPMPAISYSLTGASSGTGAGSGSGYAFNKGVTHVLLTATNACGNANCSFDVTVEDHQNPGITAPALITANADKGACYATITNLGTPSFSDNCSGSVVTNDAPSNNQYPVGTTTVTWTVTDASNNSSTATQTIIVSDNEQPTITAPASLTVNTDAGLCSASGVSLGTPLISDNCGIASLVNDAPATFLKGQTTVTWTVTDIHNHTATATQTVTVTDNELPIITAPPAVTVAHTSDDGTGNCSTTVSLGTPSTNDNCGVASLTASVNGNLINPTTYVFPIGTTTVTWAVRDDAGNMASATQNVTVADDEQPGISCPASISHTADADLCSYSINPGAATAIDNCTTSPAISAVRNDALGLSAPYPVGVTTITWTADDGHGNSSTCTQSVAITDDQAPDVVCKPYTLTLSGGAGTVNVSDIKQSSSDNCGIATEVVSPNTFHCSDAGTAQTVTLTVTDIHGNIASCSTTVTIKYKPGISTIGVTPSNTTYTGGVPTNIYLGYGPQSATLSVTASGGGTGYNYSWSPTTYLTGANTATPVFAPTAPGTYTFIATATNSSGCAVSSTPVTFCVKDIRVPGSNDKVYICHVPGSNTANAQTLAISASAVSSHLGSHALDALGACDQSCGTEMSRAVAGTRNEVSEMVRVYPNPNTGAFTLELPYFEQGASIHITDVSGKVVFSREVENGDVPANKFHLKLDDAARGFYFVEVYFRGNNQYFRTKIVVQ